MDMGLAFTAGQVASSRGWADAHVVAVSQVAELTPEGGRLVVLAPRQEFDVAVARRLAALHGAGRTLLVITDTVADDAVRDWLPGELLIEPPYELDSTTEHAADPDMLDDAPESESLGWGALIPEGTYCRFFDAQETLASLLPAPASNVEQQWQRFISDNDLSVQRQPGELLYGGGWTTTVEGLVTILQFRPCREEREGLEFLLVQAVIAGLEQDHHDVISVGSWAQDEFANVILGPSEQILVSVMIARSAGAQDVPLMDPFVAIADNLYAPPGPGVRRVLDADAPLLDVTEGPGQAVPVDGYQALQVSYLIPNGSPDWFDAAVQAAIDSLLNMAVLIQQPDNDLEGRCTPGYAPTVTRCKEMLGIVGLLDTQPPAEPAEVRVAKPVRQFEPPVLAVDTETLEQARQVAEWLAPMVGSSGITQAAAYRGWEQLSDGILAAQRLARLPTGSALATATNVELQQLDALYEAMLQSPTPTPAFCGTCGQPAKPQDLFCGSCGTALT